jgi:arsenate reductase
MITFIEYPPCSTCKKAKAFLQANNIEFKTRHIVKETPTKEELLMWIHDFEMDIDNFFNTHGKSYHELGLKDKKASLSVDEKTTLLAQDGMLIKRPLLIMDNRVLIGFKISEWEAVLKTK